MTAQDAAFFAEDYSNMIEQEFNYKGQKWIVKKILIANQGDSYEVEILLRHPTLRGIEFKEKISAFLEQAQKV